MDEKDLVLATTNWIDKWLEAERVNGAAENTINAYRRGLHRFLGWLAEQGEKARMAESEEQLPSNGGWWCSFCPRNIDCEAFRLQSVEVY